MAEPQVIRRRLKIIRRAAIAGCVLIAFLTAAYDALVKTKGSRSSSGSFSIQGGPRPDSRLSIDVRYSGWSPYYSRVDLNVSVIPDRQAALELGLPWVAVQRTKADTFIFRRADGSLTPPIVLAPHHSNIDLDQPLAECQPDKLQPGRTRFFWGSLISLGLYAAARLHILLGAVLIAIVLTRENVWIRGHSNLCEQCGYDLRGNLAAGCPECGWQRGNAAAG